MTIKENEEIYSYIQKKEVHVVAYLLEKLKPNLMKIYQEYCPFVEIKEFNYTKYPDYVRKLKQYRWKLLAVAQELEEYDVVLWFDTSVVFGNGKETFQVNLYYIITKEWSIIECC